MSNDILCPHCGKWHRSKSRFCPTTGQRIPTAPLGGGGLTGRLPKDALLNNRYIIVRKIGQGGMAAVYQATDTRAPGIWAVKEMSDTAIQDPADRPAAIQAFQQEARLLRTLNHPNMPRVVDVFNESGKHYLVMEYIEGYPLDELLKQRNSPFSEAEILPWAMQLCDVLAYLHSQNIIFRDLKPGNIMLTKDNRIKLIDFGIVRFFNPKKTKDTQAIGTPGYFGPEALHGQTDARSDIYSLSVTLHQLVTGYDPGTSVFHIPAARTINPRVSQEMERILLRGHQTDRNQRWTSMNEMRAAFSLLSKAYSAGGSSSSYINNNLGPTVSTQGAIKTSRPTQKLILAASQLSTNQLMLLSGGLVLTIVIATWVLTPILNSIRIDWNIVPLTALFGAFGYAALPRRGSAAGAHILLGGALTLTINVRLGWTGTYTGPDLFWGLVVSGLAMEVWVTFLNRIKGRNLDEAWKREIGWLAAMATLGTIILFGLLFDGLYFRNILQWIMAGLLGAAGWFLGDLIQQTILYRRTGFRQLP